MEYPYELDMSVGNIQRIPVKFDNYNNNNIKIKSEIASPILLPLSNTILQYSANRKRKRDDFILTRKRKFSEI